MACLVAKYIGVNGNGMADRKNSELGKQGIAVCSKDFSSHTQTAAKIVHARLPFPVPTHIRSQFQAKPATLLVLIAFPYFLW
jgi:hypothetical protein